MTISDDFKELEARLRRRKSLDWVDPDLEGAADAIAMLRAERDAMREVLADAYRVLAYAFNRIHGLPRTSDTELATDIEKMRARIETLRKLSARAALPPAIP
jgi:hypothetical protein